MNRRELCGLPLTMAAASLAAQVNAPVNVPIYIEKTAMSMEERRKQYAICKVRGHSPDADMTEVLAFDNGISSRPSDNPYQSCRYCRTLYRFVLDEADVPTLAK